MKSSTTFFLIIGLLLIGVLGFIYIKYELPNKNENSDVLGDVSVLATYDNKLIKTKYSIFYDGEVDLFRQGETLEETPILQRLNINSTFIAYNSNMNEQNYYISVINSSLKDNIVERIEFELIKPGTLIINHSGDLDINNILNINITSVGEIRNLNVCVDKGLKIFNLNTNLERIDKIKGYSSFDKCFKIKDKLVDENIGFELNYEKFGTLDNRNFIKLIFVDGDVDPLENKLISTDKEDLFMKDVEYIITKR